MSKHRYSYSTWRRGRHICGAKILWGRTISEKSLKKPPWKRDNFFKKFEKHSYKQKQLHKLSYKHCSILPAQVQWLVLSQELERLKSHQGCRPRHEKQKLQSNRFPESRWKPVLVTAADCLNLNRPQPQSNRNIPFKAEGTQLHDFVCYSLWVRCVHSHRHHTHRDRSYDDYN